MAAAGQEERAARERARLGSVIAGHSRCGGASLERCVARRLGAPTLEPDAASRRVLRGRVEPRELDGDAGGDRAGGSNDMSSCHAVNGRDRTRHMYTLDADELTAFLPEPSPGSIFETDLLDMYRARFRVVELLPDDGAKAKRLAWVERPSSGDV